MKVWEFHVPIRIPSKKNSMEIHIGRNTLGRITKRVGPSAAVKQAETVIAWTAKREIQEVMTGTVALIVKVSGRMDSDNALAVIYDGLQLSGRIINDSQIKAALVVKQEGKLGCDVVVIRVDEGEDPLICLNNYFRDILKPAGA